MIPPAEPNAPTADVPAVAEILQDGEEVILAIKPSPWFVVLVSWPVLLGAAVLAAAAHFASQQVPYGQTLMLICLAAACARVLVACFQWTGNLYVLTNRRVMRIRGVVSPDVWDCPLRQVRKTQLATTTPERTLRLGTLLFFVTDADRPQADWSCIARPDEIAQTVNDAIRRAR